MYEGGAEARVLLLCSDLASSCWFLRWRRIPDQSPLPWRHFFVVAFLHLIGRALGVYGILPQLIDSAPNDANFAGLGYTGSALYIVIYAGQATGWAALLSTCVMHRRYNRNQQAALALLVIGMLGTASSMQQSAERCLPTSLFMRVFV